ncbi:MAG: 30S ribosomal protein S17 [Thermoplasmata archaeon HGW-Thermoplasmata-2]|nr:MAG: 30S ribosomal protein S17 [Thermoplasmata archaeon HGW-Thermoplasmata-2]
MVEEKTIADVKAEAKAEPKTAAKVKKPKAKKGKGEAFVAKAPAAAKPKVGRDIGLGVAIPKESCGDFDCPFHGTLSVRGQVIGGVVVSAKMANTVIVEKEYLRKVAKYERFEKRTSRYPAHNPPCVGAKVGDKVRIGECRPLSKTVSFVVIAKNEAKALPTSDIQHRTSEEGA